MPTLNPILEARSEWLAETRSDSMMGQLSEEAFCEVVGWRWNKRLALERVQEMAAAEGYKVPAISALSSFFSDFSPYLRRAHVRAANLTASEILKGDAPEYVQAIKRQLALEVFQMQLDPSRDQKHFVALLDRLARMESGTLDEKTLQLKVQALEQKAETDAKKLEQAERKLAILEAKNKSAEEVLGDADMTEEEKAARMKAIFGITT